LKEYE